MTKTRSLAAIALLFLLASTAWSAEAGGARGRDGNLVVNPGLEARDKFDWRGSSAAAEWVRTDPRSGKACLCVRDKSDSVGQGNSALFPVRPGGRYYVEAWVRSDGDRPGVVTLHGQFYDADEKYLNQTSVGHTKSAKWTRLGGTIVVPEGAATATLRVIPAGPDPTKPGMAAGPLKGACFADDFYVAPYGQAVAAGRVAENRRDPEPVGKSIVTDPLVLHYTFDKDAGDAAKDRSVHGNDGKLTAVEYLEEFDGRKGVLRFDGKESSLSCGNSESLHFGGDLSFEMWVRLNGPVDDDAAFIFGYPGQPFFFGRFYVHTLMLKYNCGEGGGEAMRVPVDNTLITDEWAHVSVVVEYPRCRFYKNGKLFHDAYMLLPGILKMKNRAKYIGGGPYGGHCPMDLDEFRLYRRALTAAEVAAHAEGREVAAKQTDELAVEPRWYEKTVVVRLSSKRADYGGHTAEMSLLKDGKPVAPSQKVALAESFEGSGRYVAEAAFPLAGLMDKSVKAVVRIVGPGGKAIKEIDRDASLKKPGWVYSKEGYTDKIPAPWTPVEAESKSDGTVEVSVWGRRHVFGTTPLIRKIETRGKHILAAPIRLTALADDKIIAWRDGRTTLKESSKTAARIEQVCEDERATLRVDANIEYDGYMIFDCRVEAHRGLMVEELTLDVHLLTRHATLCLGMDVFPENRKIPMNKNYSGAVDGDLAFRFASNVWLGDEERGLCWQAESDEDWRHADEQKAIEILPRGGTTFFRAHLIAAPTRLRKGQTLHYKFALLATPMKPMLRDSWDLRIARSDPYGEDLSLPDRKTGDKTTLQYYADAGLRRLFTNVNTMWPYPMPPGKRFSDGLHRLVKETHAHGLKLHCYLIHQRYPIMAPEFDVHGLHMVVRPLDTYTPGGVVENPDGTPRKPHRYHGPVSTHWGANSQGTVGFCPQSMAAQDAVVDSLARRFDAYDEDGVYLDGTGYIQPCRNTVHGCGYRAADGSIRPTFAVFAQREFMRRIYIALKQRKPDGVMDVHQSFGMNTASMAYTDILWTGEHWWHLKHTGTDHLLDVLPLPMFRTEFMGYALGTPAEMLAYRLTGAQFKKNSRNRAASISLLHDVPVRTRTDDKEHFETMSKIWKLRERFGAKEAEKLFYWNNEQYVSVSPETCYATLLKHPKNGVLVLVSNLRRDARTVSVELALNKLGLQGKTLNAFNALNNGPITVSADGKLSVSIGSEEWVYVWLRPTAAK